MLAQVVKSCNDPFFKSFTSPSSGCGDSQLMISQGAKRLFTHINSTTGQHAGTPGECQFGNRRIPMPRTRLRL